MFLWQQRGEHWTFLTVWHIPALLKANQSESCLLPNADLYNVCNCACVSCCILDSERLRITSWCWPSSWWSREDVVSVFGQFFFFLLLLYILLEFPKQIKTVLFWGNLRPLPVTRVIPSGQSRRDHVISKTFLFFWDICKISLLKNWLISLGNTETFRGREAFFQNIGQSFLLWQSVF